MARIDIPDGPGGDPVQVWTLRPEMSPAVSGMIDAAYHRSRIPPREREAARVRIAQLNDCPICHDFRAPSMQRADVREDLYESVANWREREELTVREKLAVEYAERFASDHTGVDDAFFRRLREHFADDEVLDLTICLSVYLGLGRLLNVLQIEQACDLPG